MKLTAIAQTTSFKLSFIALGFSVLCYFLNSNESINNKAKRISFPGITYMNFNQSAQNLNLEKVEALPEPALVQNLTHHKIKILSSLFRDKHNNLTVAIGQNLNDQQLVFALIKNNQVTQIQKINEITNEKISLQYGKIILNTPTKLALKSDSSTDL